MWQMQSVHPGQYSVLPRLRFSGQHIHTAIAKRYTTADKAEEIKQEATKGGYQKMIDGETKKCTGCGRQYFRGLHINKFVALLLILLPLLAGSIGINAYLYLQIQDMEMHLATLQSHCTELQKEVEELEKSNEDALIVIADQQEHIEELKTITSKLRKGENVPLTFSEWKEQQKEKEKSGS